MCDNRARDERAREPARRHRRAEGGAGRRAHGAPEAEARASGAEAMVAHLKLLIAKLRREQYGQSSERGRKLLDQLELQLEEAAASAAEDEAAAAPAAGTTVGAFTRRKPVRAPFPAHLPRERVVIAGADRLPVLRRQAGQARRDHHRDPGGGAAAMEGDPDRAREVHLPVVREDHPAAGAVPRHPARPCRAEPAGDDPLRQVWRASAAEPAERNLCPRRRRPRRLDLGRSCRRRRRRARARSAS